MSRPWMPWYVADFVADTQHLDAALTGAYMLLIGHYWLRGQLPDDDAALARIARMSAPEWRKARPTLQAFFRDGWKHKRIDEELAHAADVSNKRRAAVEQREIKRGSIDPSNDDQKITQSPSPSPPPSEVLKLNGVGKKKANGWSPPRHGARSEKHGTVYVVKGTPEWPPYAADYFHAHGKEPVPDEGGGCWFKICGYVPLPEAARFTRQ